MVFVSVKVGPKGQIVIPKVFRDEYALTPGEEVLVGEETAHGAKELVVKKKGEDFIKFLEEFSKKHGIKKFKYDADKAYDEMMQDRFGPLLKKLDKLKRR